MKSILISIQPQHVKNICTMVSVKYRQPIYKKNIEIRKTRPQEVPFKAYIYETKAKYKTGTGIFAYGIELKGTAQGRGKVIGEFVCDKIVKYPFDWTTFTAYRQEHFIISDKALKQICLTREEFDKYGIGNHNQKIKTLYGWHISDLKIYDKPKELGMFYGNANCTCEGTGYCHKICADNCLYRNGEYYHSLTRPPISWCYVEER